MSKITLEALAAMVQRGFEDTEKRTVKRLESTLASKKDVNALEDRLDRIENLLLRAHDNRLDALEDKMRRVTTHLKLS